MVIPLVPVAMAALGGLAGGALLASFGMGGDEQAQSIPEQKPIQTSYAPISNIVNYTEESFQYQRDSPGAIQTTKKESMIKTPSISIPTQSQIPTASQAQSTGIKPADFTPLLVVAGAAYVAVNILDVKK